MLTILSVSSDSKASKTLGTSSAGSLSITKVSQASDVLELLLVEEVDDPLPSNEDDNLDFLAGTVGAKTPASLFLSLSTTITI